MGIASAAAEPTLCWRVAAIEGVWLHGDTRAGSNTVGTSAIGIRGLLEPGFSCLESQGACPALLHRGPGVPGGHTQPPLCCWGHLGGPG